MSISPDVCGVFFLVFLAALFIHYQQTHTHTRTLFLCHTPTPRATPPFDSFFVLVPATLYFVHLVFHPVDTDTPHVFISVRAKTHTHPEKHGVPFSSLLVPSVRCSRLVFFFLVKSVAVLVWFLVLVCVCVVRFLLCSFFVLFFSRSPCPPPDVPHSVHEKGQA